MNTSLKTLLVVALLGPALACSSSNFSGESKAKKSADANGKDGVGKDGGGKDGAGKDGGDKDGGGKDGAGKVGGKSGGKDGLGSETDQGGHKDGSETDILGQELGGLEVDTCLTKKADNYNLVIILDNSGSQLQNDPQNVRGQGASLFVDQFAEYAKKFPKASVNMAVLSFNTQNKRMPNGWVKLSADGASRVKSDIAQASAQPGGGTAYSPSLKDASALFSELGGASSGDRVRNYVIFLTDGLPNAMAGAGINPNIFFPGGLGGLGPMGAEKMEDIPAAVDVLVNNHRAAVISIASGRTIPAEGEHVCQSLAKPTAGSHAGKYYRASNADDLKNVWEKLLAEIGKCE